MILPYRLTALEIFCYLNLEDSLKEILSEDISFKMVQSFKGGSVVEICAQKMSYGCADTLFKYFYSNKALLRSFEFYIANDINDMLTLPSKFLNKIF